MISTEREREERILNISDYIDNIYWKYPPNDKTAKEVIAALNDRIKLIKSGGC